MRTGNLNFAPHILSLGTVLLLFSFSASAQGFGAHGGGAIAPRGAPASVTSFGFGGHPGFHGVPASVTSQGFGGHVAFRGFPPSVTSQGFGRGIRMHERPFRRDYRRGYGFYSPFYGGYYAPYDYYPYDYSDNGYVDDPGISADIQAQRDYDALQQLENDYRTQLNSSRVQQASVQTAPEPVANQPSTVLIFKDGHQVEVENYAIVGATLYELSDGYSKKVQLADLDLPATVKENDNRGVEFQLPAGSKLN